MSSFAVLPWPDLSARVEAPNVEAQEGARGSGAHLALEVRAAGDRPAVDLGDHVADGNPGVRRRPAREDVRHDDALDTLELLEA